MTDGLSVGFEVSLHVATQFSIFNDIMVSELYA